jgi:hypothetical protein
VPAGLDGLAAGAELDVNVGVGGQEIGRQVYDGGLGRGDLQVVEEGGGDPFVDQNAPVLRIIEELDDVEVAIVAFEQVGLRSAAHFPDEAGGVDGHGWEVNVSF